MVAMSTDDTVQKIVWPSIKRYLHDAPTLGTSVLHCLEVINAINYSKDVLAHVRYLIQDTRLFRKEASGMLACFQLSYWSLYLCKHARDNNSRTEPWQETCTKARFAFLLIQHV